MEVEGDFVHELPYKEDAQAAYLAFLQGAIYARLRYRLGIERRTPATDVQTYVSASHPMATSTLPGRRHKRAQKTLARQPRR